MKNFFIRVAFLSFFSYVLLGMVEDFVLLMGILLFVFFLIIRAGESLRVGLKEKLMELEKFYSFFFSLQQTRIYFCYFFLIRLKQFLYFFFRSTFFLLKVV